MVRVLLELLGKAIPCIVLDDPFLLTLDACASARYDSVIGEVGVDLNYDELVTYADASALPCKIVVYRV
jgi:hypothetical protein